MSNDQNFEDLDERARSAVTDLAARATTRPVPAFDPDRPASVPVSPAPLHRSPSRRPLFAVAAAAVVALLAAGLWIGTKGDDTDVADDVVTGSIQPYLPAVAPDGLELAGVGETDGSVDPEMSFSDQIGPLSTFGPAVDDPRVAVFASSELSFDSDSDSDSDSGSSASGSETDSGSSESGSEATASCVEQLEAGDDIDSCEASGSSSSDGASQTAPEDESTESDVEEIAVGDRTGYLRSDGAFPGVALEVPVGDPDEGPVVIVFGRDADIELLVGIASASTVEGLEVSVAPDVLPAGWRLLDTDPDGVALISPMGSLRGALQTRSAAGYYLDASQERQLVVTSIARPASSIHAQRLFLDSPETVTVRGHDAIVGRYALDDPGDQEGWTVRWEERPGEVLSLGGFGLTRDELLAAAESLQPVAPTRWLELLEATSLGDLRPADPFDQPLVELGRGRFDDGTPWVLRHGPERTDDDGMHGETLELDVALSGDSRSNSSSSFSEGVGMAIDEDGNPIEASAEVFRSTYTLDQYGRKFAAGLVRDDVARVEVRQGGRSSVRDAALLTAEGQVAWVVELSDERTTLVAFAADGTQLGSHELTADADGRTSHGPASTIVTPVPGSSDGGFSDSGSAIGSEPTTSGG